MSQGDLQLSFSLLERQDDATSSAVMQLLRDDPTFSAIGLSEYEAIVRRDQEDDVKLAAGVALSVRRGVLPADPKASPPTIIEVDSMTASEVATRIVQALPQREGNIIVLQGLSGTGKGTTAKRLLAMLPRCVAWSNGNIFRSVTLLLSQSLATEGVEFSADAITDSLIRKTMARLSFERVGDAFDVMIDGDRRVTLIENTELKQPIINARVPTVAQHTQGEVVQFAASAVETLRGAGYNVVFEGRAQTLNYIPTPHRFELVMAKAAVLGLRRAAQRVMALAITRVTSASVAAELDSAIRGAVKQLAASSS